MTDLRTSLHRLGDAVEPLPVDDDLWHRARASRRRGQVLLVAAVLTIIASVTWSAVLLERSDREARTASQASQEVPGGAIPSRIEDPGDLPATDDLALGRASVALVDSDGDPVVVTATDGDYHALDLPDGPGIGGLLALSPDGRWLAWSNQGRIHTVDLEDGTHTFYGSDAEHATVDDLRWPPASDLLLWNGRDARGDDSGGVLPVGDSPGDPLPVTALRGIPSPTGDLVAEASDGVVDAARFVQRRGGRTERELPVDLYPGGAFVRPLGWAADDLLLADVDAPPGSYATGRHLALLTSPDRPEAEWTYRIVMRDVPDVAQLSVAVDLVPDLDGTSSQQLTHDFDAPDASPASERDISWMIGLGVAAAIALLMALRWLASRAWRRLTS